MNEHINYKQFTDEEGKVYAKGIGIIRSALDNGLRFDVACKMVAVEDQEMKGHIIDDALKIEIAELHFGKGLTLLDVAKKLGVPVHRLMKAREQMLQDVINTAELSGTIWAGGEPPLNS
jgi:hypothetical protein